MSFPNPSQILPKTFQTVWDVFFMPIFAAPNNGKMVKRSPKASLTSLLGGGALV